MGTTQTRVSRWESGEIELVEQNLDQALAICGAQRCGERTLSDLLTPLQGDDQLYWYGLQAPVERIRIASLHCSAVGNPMAGITWPALLGVLKMIAEMPGCAVAGAVARSLTSPDRSNDDDLAYLDLSAFPSSQAWSLPSRLPMMQIRITQVAEEATCLWMSWPRPSGWSKELVLARAEVQREDAPGRTEP